MLEQIMNILNELRPDVDFASATALIDDGVLDSFDIISLATELSDAFDVEINVEDLEPANFNSPAAMVELVEKLQAAE